MTFCYLLFQGVSDYTIIPTRDADHLVSTHLGVKLHLARDCHAHKGLGFPEFGQFAVEITLHRPPNILEAKTTTPIATARARIEVMMVSDVAVPVTKVATSCWTMI